MESPESNIVLSPLLLDRCKRVVEQYDNHDRWRPCPFPYELGEPDEVAMARVILSFADSKEKVMGLE